MSLIPLNKTADSIIMSLIPTANAGSPGDTYFIEAAYTAGDAPMIATGDAAGIVRIQAARSGPSAGGAFLRGSPDATGLVLGATDAVNSQIVMTSANAINLNSNTNMLVPGTTLNVVNALTATAGAPGAATLDTLVNRHIHGYSDVGYVYSVSAPQAAGLIPNPGTLPIGLYSVVAAAPGDGNIGAQVSATCYWDGAAWTGSGASVNYTAGEPNCAIYPANGSATLVLGGSGGGATVPAGTVVTFRQLLGVQGVV